MKKYFKKFSLIFVMTLILSLGFCINAFATDDYTEIGKINLNNTSNNSATVGVQLTAPEIGWKRYDDANVKFTYDGSNWVSGYVKQSYKTSRHKTSALNESVTFKFYGSKIRLITATSSTEGCNSPELSIDGVIQSKTIDYNGTSGLAYQILTYEKTDLSLGLHTIKITNKSTDSNKNVIALDAIDIDDTGYLVPSNELIDIDKSSLDLTVNGTGQLTATTPAGVGVTWTSSNSNIATVDSNGKVTAGSITGTCTITATTDDEYKISDSCTVNVTEKVPDPNSEPTGTDYIVNIAHAKGDNTNNGGGEVAIIFRGLPDTTLSVVKTADVESVWVGDAFTYTIVVTNTGSKTAKAVVVNDSAPNHIQFTVNGVTTTQGTVDSSSTSSKVIVNVGDIAPGATVTIKVPATVIL